MRWHVVNQALSELPDTVVLALSDQVRHEISHAAPDTGTRGEDAVFAGASSAAWRAVDGRIDARTVRDILAYKDLALGWKIARECARRKIPLPAVLAAGGEAIFRAYLYMLDPVRFPDNAIRRVLLWKTKAMRTVAMDIEALLLAHDSTPARVAQMLRLRPDYLEVYEQLFYNVSDRKADAQWVRHHVYPNTRMVEFYEGYVQNASFRQLLTRAGVKNGAEQVLQLAGIASDTRDAMAAATSASQLETYLLSVGLLMAQNGWANSRGDSTAIFHSRHLMAAAKMGGEAGVPGDELLGLGATLWDQMISKKRPEAHRALRLQNQRRQEAIEVSSTVI